MPWRPSRCGGRRGRGDGDWRCHGERRRGLPCRRERAVPASSAGSMRSARGSRISGVVRCRGFSSTRRRSVRRRRVVPRERLFRRWPTRRPGTSASRTGESGSEGNAPSGAPALHAGRSPSTGGSCSRRWRCSTTWSCTSSVTYASRTTRDGSGRSSSTIVRTGASSALGYVTTGPSSWPSALMSDPPAWARVPGEEGRRRSERVRSSASQPCSPRSAGGARCRSGRS